jgi:acetyl-CoA carboxylase biotin carboxylase subunit
MRVRRLLIANRGEIAVRIIRACRELGLESVAVYSDADRAAPHVRLADSACLIGPASPAESYLRIPAILEAARASGADAIHPGYGFLSENARFAGACADAGLTFVGPPADVIARMGSKLAARDLMQAAGVPVVPGQRPDDQSDEGVRAAARQVGMPLLIKASAGGGGKGMRTVREEHELDEAIAAARREAQAAFGDGMLYVERLIERPRHVEVQIMADRHGHIVHLFERECSVQRRHQKVIEETPSPVLTPALRARMGDAAVAAARAAGYVNAGTIEFLLDGHGDAATFYFLEMNTRLQVEHPVTEEVTGVDLVRAQLAVASGDELPWTQAALSQRGHAIECRVYAEDPDQGFLPQAGRLLAFRPPEGPGIRVDVGVREGDTVSVHYDPLLAKLIAHGETRDAAIDRLVAALRRFVVLGIRSNVPFLLRVLQHERFRRGDVHTGFLAEAHDELMRPAHATSPDADAPDLLVEAAAAAAAWRAAQPRSAGSSSSAFGSTPSSAAAAGADAQFPDPWTSLEGWRA